MKTQHFHYMMRKQKVVRTICPEGEVGEIVDLEIYVERANVDE